MAENRTDDMRPGDEAPPQEPAVGEVECPECHGSGKLNGEACRNCQGTGMVREAVGGG